MKPFNYYNQIILKQDLINKFNYKKIKKVPQLKRIVLSIFWKPNDINKLLIALSALELITSQKAVPINRKNYKIFLKIKKGVPTGCKITLKKKIKYIFLYRLVHEIFPQIVQSKKLSFNTKPNRTNKIITFSLKPVLSLFSELEINYSYFLNLSNLNITIITNTTNTYENFFLLTSFKIPLIPH